MRQIVLAALLVSATSCQLERMFPEKVGPGVARLTVRNAATLLSLVSNDTTCGFASEAVEKHPVVEGVVGDRGRLTWTVEECALDFGELHVVSENCIGEETLVGGRVVVTAQKTVDGRLTGDPTTPIIPDSSESARIAVRAELDGLEVRISTKDTGLVMQQGTLSYVVRPHLAAASSTGACSIAGSNLSLDDITWEDGAVEIDTGDSVFEVDVPAGTFSAQLGVWGERENALEGEIQVWDRAVPVPADDDEFDGLDPDYDAAEFLESYTCAPDLAVPVSYACADLEPRLAQGVGQLLVSVFGNLSRAFDANPACGFSSSSVTSQAVITGELGRAGGSVRYDVDTPCLIELPEETALATDCNGKTTYGQGRAWITGSKVVSGIVSGDPAQPIVPVTAHPGSASIRIVLEDFRISDSASENALTVESGVVTGTSQPKTARDTTVGACAIVTPVARLTDITLDDGTVLLESSGKAFRLDVPQARIDAQNGADHDKENFLGGTVTIGDRDFALPTDGVSGLDPSYDQASFAASFACLPNMEIVDTDEECSFVPVLAEGAARLIVQTAGVFASKVNSDDNCGFENTFVLLDPWTVEGEPGEMGSMTWKIEDCALGTPDITVHEETCTGGRTLSGGVATVDATRVVTGERDTMLFVVDSIIPRDREAVTVELTDVVLDDIVVMPFAPGATAPKGVLRLESGHLTARVTPILGERASDPGVFDVPTPVAVIAEIILVDAEVVLESAGKTFRFTLDDVALHATNGTWGGSSNALGGQLTLDGAITDLGALPLDPDFNQAAFDASYACAEDLLGVVPSSP